MSTYDHDRYLGDDEDPCPESARDEELAGYGIDPTEPSYCPACDCPSATLLGSLGRLVHLRCTGCGFDYHVRSNG